MIPAPAPAPPPPGSAAWTHALQLYALPGVAPACLLLQDRLGVDVTVLLFAMHRGRHGAGVAAADLAAWDDTVRGWRAEVVRPLRQMRRALKASLAGAAPARTAAVRDKVAAAELAAEQVSFDLLEDARTVPLASVGQLDPDEIPRAVALHFARSSGRAKQVLADPAIQQALDRVARAARELASTPPGS